VILIMKRNTRFCKPSARVIRRKIEQGRVENFFSIVRCQYPCSQMDYGNKCAAVLKTRRDVGGWKSSFSGPPHARYIGDDIRK